MLKAVAGPGGHRPTRPLAGWLMVYALIGPNGGLQPVRDRDGQVMEAASELGRIDWTEYMAKGHWNDTHNEKCLVGHSTNLEFHDATTELAKAHRKVGFFTSGHLWDSADPDSWRLYTDHVPNRDDMEKADQFWAIAQALDGIPRPLGLSAHGWMQLSPCRRRILTAGCRQAAVCELPKNPASTVEPMELALHGSPLDWMRKGMVERHDSPCRTCTCPPGSACLAMRKAEPPSTSTSFSTDKTRVLLSDPRDIESDDMSAKFDPNDADDIETLIAMIQQHYWVSRADAVRWYASYLKRATMENRP